MPLEAIIFDVDGTLAETEELHRAAFNRAFAEHGLAWRWSSRRYATLLSTTGGRERIARHMAEIGLPLDPTLVTILHRAKNRIYAGLMGGGEVIPRPGVADLIEEARRRGIRLAIATTTSRSNIAALLEHAFDADASNWFAVIVAGEDVTTKKPHPEVYRRALAGLSLPAHACIAIEDSRNGLQSALACGIPTVVTPSLYTRAEEFAGAALLLGDLGTAPRVDIDALASLLPSALPAPP